MLVLDYSKSHPQWSFPETPCMEHASPINTNKKEVDMPVPSVMSWVLYIGTSLLLPRFCLARPTGLTKGSPRRAPMLARRGLGAASPDHWKSDWSESSSDWSESSSEGRGTQKLFGNGSRFLFGNGSSHPVTFVSWNSETLNESSRTLQ